MKTKTKNLLKISVVVGEGPAQSDYVWYSTDKTAVRWTTADQRLVLDDLSSLYPNVSIQP